MFVVDQLDDALQWLQNIVLCTNVGEGCCNAILTLAWLRQMEDSQQVVSGTTIETKQKDYTSIRDADSARTCLVPIKTDLFDRLKHYEQVVEDCEKWMETLRYLSSLTTRSEEQEIELQKAQFFMVPDFVMISIPIGLS